MTDRRKSWTGAMEAGKEARVDGWTRRMLIVEGSHVEAGKEERWPGGYVAAKEKGRQGVI
jgi:hypothetical protein